MRLPVKIGAPPVDGDVLALLHLAAVPDKN